MLKVVFDYITTRKYFQGFFREFNHSITGKVFSRIEHKGGEKIVMNDE